jgi:hypothetical protein
MTRLTPVQPEQAKDSVKGTLDELAARGSALGAAPAEIADEDVETLRRFGYRDEQIADVVGLVALNVLTGSFNLVAGIEPADARQRCLSAV